MSRGASILLASLAVAALSACTPAPPSGTAWSAEVYYLDLEPGTCLTESLDIDAFPTAEFDANAYYFGVADCSLPHRAQVVGIVGVPAAPEWSDFGTSAGPAISEAVEWTTGVCRAYELFVTAYVAEVAPGDDLDVSINFADIGDPRMGTCLAHAPGFATMKTVLDVEAVLALANDVELGDEVPSFTQGWFGPIGDEVTLTDWDVLDEGSCVSEYLSVDEAAYPVISCAEAHAAQFLRWVTMPTAWEGAYAGDTEAAAAAAEQCGAAQAAIDARPDLVTGVLVEWGSVGADLVTDDVFIAQCWARSADGTPLTVDLAPLL